MPFSVFYHHFQLRQLLVKGELESVCGCLCFEKIESEFGVVSEA